eukprot:9896025-Lingulodinium_polyedra.AAC.1
MHAKRSRVEKARSSARAAQLDGVGSCPLRLWEVFAGLSRAKTGKAGGQEGVVVEFLRAAPWRMRLIIAA